MILKYGLIILGSWLIIYYGFFMVMIISICTNDKKCEELCKKYEKTEEELVSAVSFCIKFALAMVLCGIALVVYSVSEM